MLTCTSYVRFHQTQTNQRLRRRTMVCMQASATSARYVDYTVAISVALHVPIRGAVGAAEPADPADLRGTTATRDGRRASARGRRRSRAHY
jgi:hypothetical protein